MFDFIQEISEARLYRNGETLKGKTAEDIAKITFLTIMMLEILRTVDGSYTKKYAADTLPFQNFTAMRPSATDLHNLLSVLAEQDKYAGKIAVNHEISVPELQIRRWLRDIENGKKDVSLDRQLFLKLETYFRIKDSTLRNIRRDVADWSIASHSEKEAAINLIKQMANRLSQQSDLYQHFKNSV